MMVLMEKRKILLMMESHSKHPLREIIIELFDGTTLTEQGGGLGFPFDFKENNMNKKGYNPDFDLDLKFGESYEDSLANILQKGKVEVKTERDIWKTTGNIVFEIRCKGKPSGISKTKADYWAQILTYKGDIKSILMFPVDILKMQLKNLVSKGKAEIIKGGDNNDSEMIVVSLQNIYSK